ncbi:MAG: trypsin-like peptidase domain-containing protein [Lentisphaeria bacterium]|nr:trypsin-like peptidase domain-containing protein [Lentisphaeria bacterium]
MKYYIKSKGKTYGPIEESKIKARVLSGFFSEISLVSTDSKEWLPLQQCITFSQPDAPDNVPPRIVPDAIEPVIPADNTQPRLRLVENGQNRPAERKPRNHKARDEKPPRSRKRFVLAAVIVIILLLLAAGAAFIMLKAPLTIGKPAAADFQQVCQRYQSAVGVVTVTLERSDGTLLNATIGGFKIGPDHPIGTAFAIDKNKFATNCHVAYGIKELKSSKLDELLGRIVVYCARKDGVRTREELSQYCRKNKKNIEELQTYLQSNVRVRNVEIRLAHSGGRSLSVTGIQIHPRYQTNPDADFRFKNSEFDVAILTTAETVNQFFPTASEKKLHSLTPGLAIAYIGFPMEGLSDNGDLDINNPEAIFKSGSISKITDFNKVFSTPEFNKSIIHDIPAAGGASGSPIFLPDGQVVAILWGVSHWIDQQGDRNASAIQHNYAVRVDSLDIVKKQKTHNLQEWVGEAKNEK